MSRFCFLLVHLSCLAVSGLAADSPTGERFTRRWISAHPGFNLQRDDQADQLIELISRGQKAGYNGVVIATSRLQLLQVTQPRSYYLNAERVRKAAEEAGVELIPRVMRINGYSNNLLSNDPNLAPALPVRNCVMQVQDRKATVTNNESILTGGAFEKFSRPNRPDGWDWLDVPGKVSFEDRNVRHSGEASIRMEHFETATKHGNCRIFKKLAVKPWHQYDLTAWIKTDGIVRASARPRSACRFMGTLISSDESICRNGQSMCSQLRTGPSITLFSTRSRTTKSGYTSAAGLRAAESSGSTMSVSRKLPASISCAARAARFV